MLQALGRFIHTRWSGEIDHRVLLQREMLIIGSLVNLVASFIGLILLASKFSGYWAAFVHFLPLPYNVFLLFCVFRHRESGAWIRLIATLWWLCMLIV
jgi:hypothetical protein